jgi:hypothetical protein
MQMAERADPARCFTLLLFCAGPAGTPAVHEEGSGKTDRNYSAGALNN